MPLQTTSAHDRVAESESVQVVLLTSDLLLKQNCDMREGRVIEGPPITFLRL
jgi:hypothetical protein